jgi:hypothetical protein
MTNALSPESTGPNAALNRYGIREVIRSFMRVAVMLAVLLLSAGSFKWVNAWIYVGLGVFGWIIINAVLIRVNPRLLNARGRGFRKTTKTFDKVFLAVFALLAIGTLVVAGLDAAAYGWSRMPPCGGRGGHCLASVFVCARALGNGGQSFLRGNGSHSG